MGMQMSWRTVSWILFGAIGLYCLGISLLGQITFAYGYRVEAHSTIMLIRYLQPLLVLPFFLLALVPRKWATLPLWILCLSVASFPFLIRDANLRALLGYGNVSVGVRVQELGMVIVIPIVVQLAAWLRLAELSAPRISSH
jgi:hypothetical protein